jgi:hypothetical protein
LCVEYVGCWCWSEVRSRSGRICQPWKSHPQLGCECARDAHEMHYRSRICPGIPMPSSLTIPLFLINSPAQAINKYATRLARVLSLPSLHTILSLLAPYSLAFHPPFLHSLRSPPFRLSLSLSPPPSYPSLRIVYCISSWLRSSQPLCLLPRVLRKSSQSRCFQPHLQPRQPYLHLQGAAVRTCLSPRLRVVLQAA